MTPERCGCDFRYLVFNQHFARKSAASVLTMQDKGVLVSYKEALQLHVPFQSREIRENLKISKILCFPLIQHMD